MSTLKKEIVIRVAALDDAEELLEIYAPYVRETAITFEYEVPSLEEFRERIAHTLEKYPYLVAEHDGKIVGYAYVSPFKERAAYTWSVETSIYVDQNCKRMGIGKKLHSALEHCLKEMGISYSMLCDSGARKVWLIYREEEILEILGKKEYSEFLDTLGYQGFELPVMLQMEGRRL